MRLLKEAPVFQISKSAASRTILLPSILAGALALTGCQSPKINKAVPIKSESEQAAFDRFLAEFQPTVARHMLAANSQSAVGKHKLRITFNRKNEVLSCRVDSPRLQSLPSMEQRMNADRLARLINQECWKIIYPLVPEHLFTDDGTVEMVVALIFHPLQAALAAQWRLRYEYQARSDYFWQQLLIHRPVDSIGVAGFRFQANAQGKVEGCLVSLDPASVRRDAFKFDNALQEQLTAQCKTLDLRQMPGFRVDETGLMQDYVEVSYAPWKVGRQ